MKALKRAFPRSIAMVYANFMPGGRPYLEAVYRAARESNVAVGGPDLMPFRPFQRENSYPLIRESAGKPFLTCRIIGTSTASPTGSKSRVES